MRWQRKKLKDLKKQLLIVSQEKIIFSITFIFFCIISIFPVDTILLTDAASCRGVEVSAFFISHNRKEN